MVKQIFPLCYCYAGEPKQLETRKQLESVVPKCVATVNIYSKNAAHSLYSETVQHSDQHAGPLPEGQQSGKIHITSNSWGFLLLSLSQVTDLHRDQRDEIHTGISPTPALEQAA